MEGHFIHGIGDASAGALDVMPFEILGGARAEADRYLRSRPATLARLDRVSALTDGFESTYGVELLATVHWVATRQGDPPERREKPAEVDEVRDLVKQWNYRKGRMFTPTHVSTAYDQLKALGWLSAPLAEPGTLTSI
jgi:hypothetical protein